MTKNTLGLLGGVILAKVLRRRIPLAVSWIITERCNYRCVYCNEHQVSVSEEIREEKVLFLIRTMARLGVKVISFTGGEPLLREDIGRILDCCSQEGILTRLNSNGALVPLRIKEIRPVGKLTLSLDGPEEVNDPLRGAGSFKRVVDAAEAAARHSVKTGFLTVLSAGNVQSRYIDFMLKFASNYKSDVTFQPVFQNRLRGQGKTLVDPFITDYREMLDYLIALKKKGANIGNSVAGLRHLKLWPDPAPLSCAGEFIFRRIDPRGNVMLCGVCPRPNIAGNCFQEDLRDLFLKTKPMTCDFCWCAERVEVNYFFKGNLNAVYNRLKRFFR
ncbi:MAG: Cyclic pyranopterin monophosphate synthase [Candidatus Omnitrophica bacterium ADurb.Bin277]|nr:MAG: Cyclic pyranopterin monophosphate synthase [Candidatus Omnitrophica bacterium ADurb.Bin277]